MKVYFPPSLLNISLSKVAVSICYAKDLNYLMAGFQYRHKCDHGETRDLIQSVVEKGNEIIFALQIPKSLKETLTGVFKATVLDINIWFSEHEFFLHIYFDILSSFHWNAEGSINRLKTAQALIQRNEASDILLLTLAATYCLEVDLERLWVNVVISERDQSMVESYFYELEYQWSSYWLQKFHYVPLTRESRIHWPLIKNEGQLLHILRSFDSDCDRRNRLIATAKENSENINMMRSCLSHLDESDLKEVFEKKRDAYEFIKKFLNWPFQTSFIPMVNQLWSYLSNRDINELLLLITFQIRQGLGDFNYVDLLEEFWDQCPAHLKEGIQKPLLN